MFDCKAAAGGGQRERALDLVAGADASAAADAELVLEGQVGMAEVLPELVRGPGHRGC